MGLIHPPFMRPGLCIILRDLAFGQLIDLSRGYQIDLPIALNLFGAWSSWAIRLLLPHSKPEPLPAI
jgi:hypothetical protein